jgi:hypothetical protein
MQAWIDLLVRQGIDVEVCYVSEEGKPREIKQRGRRRAAGAEKSSIKVTASRTMKATSTKLEPDLDLDETVLLESEDEELDSEQLSKRAQKRKTEDEETGIGRKKRTV